MSLKSWLHEVLAPNVYVTVTAPTVSVNVASDSGRVEHGSKDCPACKSGVHPEATRCPHCTSIISRV